MANARKHAHAQCVSVRLMRQDSATQIVIEDDGQGFDVAAVSSSDRQKFGLEFMRERAEQVGARLTIDSAIGKGTRVVVTVNSEQSPIDHLLMESA